MGRYLTLTLKPKYKTQDLLDKINNELIDRFGAISRVEEDRVIFSTPRFARDEAEYINTAPECKNQCPYIPRPVTAGSLVSCHPEIFDFGHIQVKISACNETEARIARALTLWSEENPDKIKINRSDNYDRETVFAYIQHFFDESN